MTITSVVGWAQRTGAWDNGGKPSSRVSNAGMAVFELDG